MYTAAEMLGKRFPLLADEINKYSQKWCTQTKGYQLPWPLGGMFDVDKWKNGGFD